MKTKILAFVFLANLLVSGAALAACTVPDDPSIPVGVSASGADMLKAKKAIEAYMTAANEYLECGVANSLHNRMVTKMEKIAKKFNSELRAYKAKA